MIKMKSSKFNYKFGYDMSSVTGLPTAILGKDTRESITGILEKVGISEKYIWNL